MTRYHNWSPCHLVPPDFQEEQLWPLGHLITLTWSATNWSTGPQSHQKNNCRREKWQQRRRLWGWWSREESHRQDFRLKQQFGSLDMLCLKQVHFYSFHQSNNRNFLRFSHSRRIQERPNQVQKKNINNRIVKHFLWDRSSYIFLSNI